MFPSTIIEKPVRSIDSDLWRVYADFLEDQGLDSSRARAIADGIDKTGGKLWITYSDDTDYCSAANNVSAFAIDLELMKYINGNIYRYTSIPPNRAKTNLEIANVPWDNPYVMNSSCMHQSFWDEMERVGRGE